MATPAGSDLARLAGAAAAALGLEPDPIRVPYGSDASKFQEGGIPALVFGPGSIAHAHSLGEFVPVAELAAAAAFYREMALRLGAAE